MVYVTRHNDRMSDDEDLTAWLRAQLDEDERVAGHLGEMVGHRTGFEERWLREVEAKRRLLDECVSADAALTEIWMWETREGGYSSGLDRAVRILALSYADRPGYQEDWRP